MFLFQCAEQIPSLGRFTKIAQTDMGPFYKLHNSFQGGRGLAIGLVKFLFQRKLIITLSSQPLQPMHAYYDGYIDRVPYFH